MHVEIQGYDLPGRIFEPDSRNVFVGLQVRKEVVDLFPGDAEAASWSFDVETVPTEAGLDLKGPAVQGPKGDRFFYLSWGDMDDAGEFHMFRRAKLKVDDGIDPALLREGAQSGKRLVGRLRLTDKKGGPACATLRPPAIEWSVQ